MIYLIGGSPRCGKTTLAQQVSKKLGISWLATDTLESIVSAETSKPAFAKRFPKSVMRQNTKNSNDLMYARYTPHQIAKAYIKQSQAVWKAIDTLVACEIHEGRSFVLEGYHVHPKLVKRLMDTYGSRNISAVFLVKTNVENIISGAVNYSSKTDWFVNKSQDSASYIKIAEMIAHLGDYFIAQSKKYKMKHFVMDSNFKPQLSRARQHLLK